MHYWDAIAKAEMVGLKYTPGLLVPGLLLSAWGIVNFYSFMMIAMGYSSFGGPGVEPGASTDSLIAYGIGGVVVPVAFGILLIRHSIKMGEPPKPDAIAKAEMVVLEYTPGFLVPGLLLSAWGLINYYAFMAIATGYAPFGGPVTEPGAKTDYLIAYGFGVVIPGAFGILLIRHSIKMGELPKPSAEVRTLERTDCQ